MSVDLVVEAEGLVKDYGRFRALNGVDLAVERGEIVGFLGPNGSGKSTTIRILLGLLRPTGGRAAVLGQEVRRNRPELRASIGYLPGELSLAGRRTGRELLDHLVRLRGGRGADRIDELAERFSLDLDRRFDSLSKGNKQKVGLVQAFMHRPELLILDEPTSGLDPLLQHEFLELTRQAVDDGATVFMSSHVLSEVDASAERVAIIREGVIVDVEDVHDLRVRAGQHVNFRFAGPVPASLFDGIDEFSDVRVDGVDVSGILRGSPDHLLKAVTGHEVVAWSAVDRGLDELFIDVYRGDDAASAPSPSTETQEVDHVH